MAKSKQNTTDLAEQRTDWAEDRTVQATERTYAGWQRTAFAAIGIGLGFRALFGEFDPPWLAKGIATIFIILGAAVSWTAQRNACKTLNRLDSHDVDRPAVLQMRWLSYIVTAAAILLAVALWFLRNSSAS
ncbi:YidH family protein [Pontixanthobacter sp.]|uniref:YidH family protein n=1 Tax=Pontixanthobacter sp. TaxID=2792078 RepID=UPI003C7B84AA